MAMKWAWGFSTDQNATKLNQTGFSLGAGTSVDSTYTHSYPGDNVSKRSSLKQAPNVVTYSPFGVAALDGWVCCSMYVTGSWNESGHRFLGVIQSGLTGIYVTGGVGGRISENAMKLYVDNTFKANSTATFLTYSWNYFALKYEGSTTTFKGTLYGNGVEIIAVQSDTATTAWSDLSLMRTYHGSPAYWQPSYFGGYVTYDSTSDAGEVEVWCSTYEPQTDDAETGTWVQSTGSDNFAVVTPWDTATYTEEVSPTTGDKFTCGFTDSIATRLGISPTIYGVLSQAAVSGGADFKALLDVGAGDVVGATVTADVNDPTYGYSIETSGITASSTIKVGIKIP